MIVVACLEAVALVAVVFLMLRHHAETQAQSALERRELLNRIQRPEQIPADPTRKFVIPDLEPDFSHLVGTIQEPAEEG